MNIALCYICVTHGPKTADYAARFVGTYHSFPPGVGHETFVICNGGPLKSETSLIFSVLKPTFWTRQNDPGWDISAYLDAAKGPCSRFDMILCLGESVHFSRAGWLKRFVEVWGRLGQGMYGAFSSNAVRSHINTTGFCTSPYLLRQYPSQVRNRKDRYEFEHGKCAFWRIVMAKGYPVRLVTWDGDWLPTDWRKPRNILWRGDQSNCLFRVNHVERFEKAPIKTKVKWSRFADNPFK